ncbi:hypothetical protein BH18ACT7_BH18ACT7_05500 [soil metagenome]
MPRGAGGIGEAVLLCVLLGLLFGGPWIGPWALRRVRDWRDRRGDRRAARRPVVLPVGQYVDDLRRLSRDLAALPPGTPWARQHGTQLAFDSVLTKLCVALDIDNELATLPVGWARDLERLRMEDAIYAFGLRIHTVGT